MTTTLRTRRHGAAIALSLVCAHSLLSALAGCAARPSLEVQKISGESRPSTRMPDGKQWTTENLTVAIEPSFCYDDKAENCRRYGRLYPWESAQRGCQSLGGGWRLPTNEEWQQLASHYGGLLEESPDGSKATSAALRIGGRSGFNAVLGGNREAEGGQYGRLEAHGLYWTASESAPDRAWLYNFGSLGLGRHRNGDKRMAVSVRCIRD